MECFNTSAQTDIRLFQNIGWKKIQLLAANVVSILPSSVIFNHTYKHSLGGERENCSKKSCFCFLFFRDNLWHIKRFRGILSVTLILRLRKDDHKLSLKCTQSGIQLFTFELTITLSQIPFTIFSCIFNFFKFIDLRERERNIDLLCPLIYAFIDWFLYMPWPGIKPTTLAYWDDALTKWATWPEPQLYTFWHQINCMSQIWGEKKTSWWTSRNPCFELKIPRAYALGEMLLMVPLQLWKRDCPSKHLEEMFISFCPLESLVV